ncbi:hypothetical protein HanPSC8_Chr10g0432421 [Helianthus annuus]|nr:hypothetical protein HanPSC8_Chr10g0432421 [Helianthus annuus]
MNTVIWEVSPIFKLQLYYTSQYTVNCCSEIATPLSESQTNLHEDLKYQLKQHTEFLRLKVLPL